MPPPKSDTAVANDRSVEDQAINKDGRESGGELFIVDNSDSEWKGLKYLQDWTEIASAFDIASGFFEIGSLLALDGRWQQLDKIRILLGAEMSARTRQALLEGLRRRTDQILDQSIEAEKEQNDFLNGVPAIVDGVHSGKIECKVYAKKKFHAKAYITHPKVKVIGSVALVGSSNFTVPGLTENVELNVQVRTPGDVEKLQKWFERYWKDGENISDDVIRVLQRQIAEYTPFQVYVKALQELFRNKELAAGGWEQTESKMYSRLDQYQKEAYHSLLKIGRQHRGALFCDGVGLGKTFVGLLLIERLVMHERKRVALFVPKSGRVAVWERNLRKFLPHLAGDFSNLAIFNHTDLMRQGEDMPYRMRRMRCSILADAIFIILLGKIVNESAIAIRDEGSSQNTAAAVVVKSVLETGDYVRVDPIRIFMNIESFVATSNRIPADLFPERVPNIIFERRVRVRPWNNDVIVRWSRASGEMKEKCFIAEHADIDITVMADVCAISI
jgi:PLD-like domain